MNGRNVRGPATRPARDEEAYRHIEDAREGGGFTWPERDTIDFERMARDAFARVDNIHDDIMNNADGYAGTGDSGEDEEEDNEVDVEYLLREANTKVFDGS